MSSRGNSLMVTMIALAVLMVLVVGAIRFTGANREAAVTKVKADRMSSCAETARRYLLSRLKLYGMSVTDVKLGGTTTYARLPDEVAAANRTLIAPAHFDEDALTASTSIGVISSSAMGASARQVRDLANTMPSSGSLGGQYYRVVMKCQEPATGGSARESEVEFVFRYGL